MNTQRIKTPIESLNNQKIQIQVAITAMPFYFIFSFQLRFSLFHITVSIKRKKR